MEEITALDIFLIICWLSMYGASIVMAVAQYDSTTHKQLNAKKKLFWKILPYVISVAPTLYQSLTGHELLNAGLFAVTFLILTWVLVFSVRKQWQRGAQ